MPIRRTNRIPTAVGVGLSTLVLIIILPFTNLGSALGRLLNLRPLLSPTSLISQAPIGSDSDLATLINLSPAQRSARLETIAKGAKSLDQSRARYLLASDLIRQNQPAQALPWLDGLERDYPVLAAQIAWKRAQATSGKGDSAWQALLRDYPDSPVAAEALFTLGKTDAKYWDQAIAQLPSHPRTLDVARQRLRKAPKDPEVLLVLTKHGFYAPGIMPLVDRLVNTQRAALKPEDWESIAFAYWENQEYGKAGQAYAKAKRTPLTAYRNARGLQLGNRQTESYELYQRVLADFPSSPEAAISLLRMAKIKGKTPQAIRHLDLLISRYPDRAGEALLLKADIFDSLKSQKSAQETRYLLLKKYSSSDAAAELRWQQAQQSAKLGSSAKALQWVQEITTQNPDSPLAPEAGFWVGKWSERLGKSQDAKTAYEMVLSRYPGSYYAWRSATHLNLDVGDFSTVRQMTPQVVKLSQRFELPAGSAALKELYQLGEDRDAWTLWQVEFKNFRVPTVAEQFTDGVMRVGVGDNLDGLFMLTSLENRTIPSEQSEYRSLRQTPMYWQALHPFPFLESIENWSQDRQLNPLLVTALIRQESRFEPKIRSVVGATGLMQVMPETGAWIAEKIKLKTYKLSDPDDSIKMGTWYLDYTHQEYNNNSMLAVASYNAGPGSVADWVSKKGVGDPDEFVEAIPFDETRGYVKSVFGNYWNYLRLYNPETTQLVSRYAKTDGVAKQ